MGIIEKMAEAIERIEQHITGKDPSSTGDTWFVEYWEVDHWKKTRNLIMKDNIEKTPEGLQKMLDDNMVAIKAKHKDQRLDFEKTTYGFIGKARGIDYEVIIK